MKKIVTLLLLVFTATTFAQKTIDASDLMSDIKSGKTINISNATITGIIDFTFMEDAITKLPKRKKRWWGSYGSNEVKEKIKGKISFTNCVFEDHVLAYIPDEDSGYTFTADFEESVVFKNCTFEQKAMFKYSDFEKDTDFSGTKFLEDSTFKYAEFNSGVTFANTHFEEPSTFKYSKFRENVSFANAIFKDTAIFKYTKFKDGVSFNNTQFKEDLNIKYAKVTGEFDTKNMDVAYDIDSKYTKINGKSFSKYLLKNR